MARMTPREQQQWKSLGLTLKEYQQWQEDLAETIGNIYSVCSDRFPDRTKPKEQWKAIRMLQILVRSELRDWY